MGADGDRGGTWEKGKGREKDWKQKAVRISVCEAESCENSGLISSLLSHEILSIAVNSYSLYHVFKRTRGQGRSGNPPTPECKAHALSCWKLAREPDSESKPHGLISTLKSQPAQGLHASVSGGQVDKICTR